MLVELNEKELNAVTSLVQTKILSMEMIKNIASNPTMLKGMGLAMMPVDNPEEKNFWQTLLEKFSQVKNG